MICGKGLSQLGKHIRISHNLTGKKYKELYPGSKLVCDRLAAGVSKQWKGSKRSIETRAKMGAAKAGIPKSEEHKKKLKETGTLFGYGRKQPEGHIEKLAEINRARDYPPCSEEKKDKIRLTLLKNTTSEQRCEWARAGGKAFVESMLKDPEKKHAFYHDPVRMSKWMLGLKRRPTKPELFVDRITPDNIQYVGDGSFILRLKDKCRNPDFVVRPFRETKTVIEVFGDYWHRNDDPEDYISEYAECGYQCIVIWEHEIDETVSILQEKGVLQA